MKKIQAGEIIRELRKNKGITQEQLAEVLEVSTPAISKWESCQTNPDISILPIIARFFNVSIDFLLGFSSEVSDEEIKIICDDVQRKFRNQKLEKAKKEWSNYLRQFPTNHRLRYKLAVIGVFNLDKAQSLEEMYSFANKLISIFEQCSNSDELEIKQGSYFQMANLYIALQNFDKAQTILAQIPKQSVNTSSLLSMVYINKGNFEQANRNIQESIHRSLADIIIELSNMISIHHLNESNSEEIIELFSKQKQLISIFGLEPIYGIGLGLQYALQLAQNGEYERARAELKQVIDILEKYPQRAISIENIDFFKDIDSKTELVNNHEFQINAYRVLVNQIFGVIGENDSFQELEFQLEQALSMEE